MLILASGSPRRRELLQEAGFAFKVVTAEVEELDGRSAPELGPVELAQANAARKAEAVARLKPDDWVLAADTVVFLADPRRIFGKPGSSDEAREFLRTLSGQTHEVVTACVLRGPNNEAESFHEISQVTFLPLSDELIACYLAAVHVLDKAGAYAVQEHGDWIIEKLEGSRTNVIGLPMEKVGEVLRLRL